jgi:integrase/recombinase XerC
MMTPEWADAIAGWMRWMQAGNTRPATLELRGSQLRRVATHFADRPPGAVTPDDLAGWLCGHNWGPETLRSHRSALRTFYRYLVDHGGQPHDPTRLLRRIKPAPVRVRAASDDVIVPAIAAATDRVALMLMLGSFVGMRRGEIARIRPRDLVRDLVGWSITIDGKGGRIRTIPLRDDIATRIAALPGPYAFPGPAGHLTPAYVGRLMKRAMDGVTTAHQLRHRYATTIYRRSHDIESVRRLVGHASVATTQRYISVDDDRLREVARFAG